MEKTRAGRVARDHGAQGQHRPSANSGGQQQSRARHGENRERRAQRARRGGIWTGTRARGRGRATRPTNSMAKTSRKGALQGHTTAGPRPSRPRPWGRAMVERSMSLSEIRAGKERRPDLAEEAENYAWPQGRDTGEEPRHAGTLGRTRQADRATSRRRSEQGGARSHGGTLGAARKLQGAGRAHGWREMGEGERSGAAGAAMPRQGRSSMPELEKEAAVRTPASRERKKLRPGVLSREN
ncbi:hypothetical protein Zm00014a_018301 [Zea mays]|jgi:hypothetical protein|uniref:Uncharacterized protein n=2 Tax=Zea mays TaxID=4577 RepID=A0A1D6I0B7_MAIZE|nr:hypothetical protein ZEAMMB73_Zm00001d019778 [Zea mays]PWZ14368.1 hypothetical protein Zm00014a_018301 [Zea mays]